MHEGLNGLFKQQVKTQQDLKQLKQETGKGLAALSKGCQDNHITIIALQENFRSSFKESENRLQAWVHYQEQNQANQKRTHTEPPVAAPQISRLSASTQSLNMIDDTAPQGLKTMQIPLGTRTYPCRPGTTAASATAGIDRNTVSTSPGSIRKPRILIC